MIKIPHPKVKIENGIKPPVSHAKTGIGLPFANMKVGDSLYLENTSPQRIASAFGRYLATGRYTIAKEGKGFRFFLLKK